MKKKLKVAVIFNEANPELYVKTPQKSLDNADFVPYFEVDDLTPIEEYEQLAERLARKGLEAYTLNIKDDIDILIKNIKKHKPDVVFPQVCPLPFRILGNLILKKEILAAAWLVDHTENIQ